MQAFFPFTRYRRLIANSLFIVLTLLSGWYPAFKIMEWGWDLSWDQTGEASLLLVCLKFGPGIAAFIAVAFARGSFRKELCLHAGKPFYLLPAWFLLPLLAVLTAAVSVLLGLAEWDWHMTSVIHDLCQRWPQNAAITLRLPSSTWALWAGSLLFGPIIWFLPAWAEETAWRGYIFHWLQKKGFWSIALFSGFICWIWKLPLYWLGYIYPNKPVIGALLGLGFSLCIGIILTWLRIAAKGILAPAFARATLSSAALIPLTFTQLYDPIWTHLQGVVGLVLLSIFILFCWQQGLYKRPG